MSEFRHQGPDTLSPLARGTLVASVACLSILAPASAEQTPFKPTVIEHAAEQQPHPFIDEAQTNITIESCNPTPDAVKTEALGMLKNSKLGLGKDPYDNALELFGTTKEGASQYYAEQNGLHIADGATPYYNIAHSAGMAEAPYRNHFSLVSNFMEEQFGVGVELGYSDTRYPEYIDAAPSDETLESANAKQSTLNMLLAFNELPKELVRLTGLREIHFVKDVGGAYAITGNDERKAIVIGIQPDSVIPVGTYRHELMHLLDTALCGSPAQASNDPEYADLNTLPNVYGEEPYTQVLDDNMRMLMSDIDIARGRKNTPEYCQLVAREKLRGPRLQTVSEYHPTVVEDKAELAMLLLDPAQYSVVLNPNLSVLKAKFELEFSRLYRKDPALAKYYASMSAFVDQRYYNYGSFYPNCAAN